MVRKKKRRSEYEIEIVGGRSDDYGMPTNPPIVACGKNKKDVLKQFRFPKKIRVTKIKRVGKCPR